MANQKTLERLLDLLSEDLVKRIDQGTATAADLNVARQLLKDNNISAIPTKSNGLGKLAESLPFNDPDAMANGSEAFN